MDAQTEAKPLPPDGFFTGSVQDREHSGLPSGRRLLAQGRPCHGVIAWLPGAISPQDARRRLQEAARSRPELGSTRLWETRVPAARDSPQGLERAWREVLRPVHDDLSPLRAVLLTYSDGAAALVLVALRHRVPRTMLEQVAGIVLGDQAAKAAEPPCADAPAARPLIPPSAPWAPADWGLGDPKDSGTVSARPLAVPGRGQRGRQLLLGALALTISRYSGQATVEIGQLDTVRGRQRATVLSVQQIDEQQCAAAWLVISPSVADLFCASIERLTARLAADGGESVLSTIPVMSPEETAQVLRLGGAGRGPGPAPGPAPDRRIDERFEDVARRLPDAVALVDSHGELTYRQLDERADRVAAGLRAAGVAQASKVGVCLDRDASLVIAMLGILKAGCAYVPMDFRYPPDRLRYIVESARIPLVIGDGESFPPVADVRVVGLDELSARGGPGGGVRQPGTPADAAYVIYTSGSTGRPKGVVIPHRNVIALLEATETDFALGPDDVWTLFHSSAFDFSVWEIWGCLLSGGRLVVVSYWTARDPDEFHRLLIDQRVTVLNQTPSAFAQLVRADRSAKADLAVRLLVFGGEPLDVGMLAPWFAGHSHTWCRVVNMFGITETTVHVTAQTITPADLAAASRSVGRPLPGWSVSVRDEWGRVLPPGAAGEVYVGGAGLAAGYLGRPELTADRFITDDLTGERLYRSGDKGRLHPDGRLDHLGRLDHQVKIRGHRIELGEIRSVLAGDPAVSEAVVVATEASPDDSASSRIDAYVVPAQDVDTSRILDNARRMLPDYMVPSTLTRITAIPLTTNGKPDLSRLPPPTAAGRAPDPVQGAPADTSPSGDLAAEILGIWSHCLKAEVSMDDNFFLVGGNSLLVLRVLRSMQERGLPKIAPRDFYSHSTAAEFIRLIATLRDESGSTREPQ